MDEIEVFQARRDRLLFEAGVDRSVDCIAVFGHGSALGAGTQSHGQLRFLTGWDGRESPSLLLVDAEGPTLLVGSPFMMPIAAAFRPDLRPTFLPPANWAERLALFAHSRRLGVAGFDELPGRIAMKLQHGSSSVVPLDDMLAWHRSVKDELAIARLCDAAALCDVLFSLLPDMLGRGWPGWRMQLELEIEARRLGADYCRTWLTIGPAADYPRYWPAETTAVPQAGDQVLLGIALTVDGHWGHGIRMGAVGAVMPAHAMLAGHVEAMLQAAEAAIVPGKPLAGVEAAIEHVFRERIAPAYAGTIRRFRNGHGLGLSYEEPLLTDCFPQHFAPVSATTGADVVIRPGMVIELHPNLFVPGVGGAAVGEMIRVSDRGPEPMLATPRACRSWI